MLAIRCRELKQHLYVRYANLPFLGCLGLGFPSAEDSEEESILMVLSMAPVKVILAMEGDTAILPGLHASPPILF